MDRATFVFKLVEEIAKNFFSALPRMEAVCEVVDLKLEAKVVEDDDSVSSPFSTIRLLLLPL